MIYNILAKKIATDMYNICKKENMKFFPDNIWPIELHSVDVEEIIDPDTNGRLILAYQVVLKIKKLTFESKYNPKTFEEKLVKCGDFCISEYLFKFNPFEPTSNAAKEIKEKIMSLINEHYLNKNSKYGKFTGNPCAEIDLPGLSGECVKFTHFNGLELDEPMIVAPTGKPKTKIDNELLLLL